MECCHVEGVGHESSAHAALVGFNTIPFDIVYCVVLSHIEIGDDYSIGDCRRLLFRVI